MRLRATAARPGGLHGSVVYTHKTSQEKVGCRWSEKSKPVKNPNHTVHPPVPSPAPAAWVQRGGVRKAKRAFTHPNLRSVHIATSWLRGKAASARSSRLLCLGTAWRRALCCLPQTRACCGCHETAAQAAPHPRPRDRALDRDVDLLADFRRGCHWCRLAAVPTK